MGDSVLGVLATSRVRARSAIRQIHSGSEQPRLITTGQHIAQRTDGVGEIVVMEVRQAGRVQPGFELVGLKWLR